METPRLAAGRSCAGCTLCCKLLSIAALDKPRARWCKHCDPGRGCKIYDDRPNACQNFYCTFLLDDRIGEHWKPSSSKMVLTYEPDQNRIVIHVDPGRPGAWQGEPFYSEIKEWSVRAAQLQGQVLVYQGQDAIVVLPDREVNLGLVGDDQVILTSETPGPDGVRFNVIVADADDPRVQDPRVQKLNAEKKPGK